MSKEETSAGLLSKMVKFVRNPATNWTDLDAAPADKDDAVNKQLLKEMIERKRRNDFVRKREFDMLRKLRKREAMGHTVHDQTGRPSFFQSSIGSRPDDRASTLKKIDEIEAQMSMQWWKTKGQDGTAPAAQAPGGGPQASSHVPLGASGELPRAYRTTEPASLEAAANIAKANLAQAVAKARSEQVITQPSVLSATPSTPLSASVPSPEQPPSQPVARPVPVAVPAPAPASPMDSGGSGFSLSKSSAVEVDEMLPHDAEIEEAAIRFANSDDEGAEAGLLEILSPGAVRAKHLDTWLTLFDLYRATGQHDKYETAAIRFVECFERSAPNWFSMPELVKSLGPAAGPAASNSATADWVCPSVLGLQTVAALKAAMARAAMPWRLEWKNLKSIDPLAVEPLTQVFASWAAQPVQLRFLGDAQLQKVLEAATPSGDRSTPEKWWNLRMEALRVTYRPDDFELTALDFCVTYEVSPPAWVTPVSDYKPLDAQGQAMGGHTIIGEPYRDSTSSPMHGFDHDSMLSGFSSPISQLLTLELSGQIEGDAIEVLDKLEAKLAGADQMHISCTNLIRVDFSAAGSLLNWVSARETEGRVVQFSDVNRLVAAFFNVIGITEHARVLVRSD